MYNKEKIKNYLYNKKEIIFSYIYGSVAKGTNNKLSDIDIAIYIDKDKKPNNISFGYRSKLISELQSLLNEEVDLIILNDSPLSLSFNVLKEGKLLFTKSKTIKTSYHEKIMRSYLDFKPMFKVQEQHLKENIKSNKYRG